ncbi:hypothetical protein DIPPA_10926 [Diplonema papillatum]|nr:hypothetical protein DIPPA_10926 [Diplonema papillatum]|eukprot:gene9223-14296_t
MRVYAVGMDWAGYRRNVDLVLESESEEGVDEFRRAAEEAFAREVLCEARAPWLGCRDPPPRVEAMFVWQPALATWSAVVSGAQLRERTQIWCAATGSGRPQPPSLHDIPRTAAGFSQLSSSCTR